MSKLKQVLLVDDDPDYGYLVQEALSDCQPPCRLTTLSSGIDLLDWLETNEHPTVIFLDINMPVSTGFDILKLLKSADRYKAIPVVMLSVSLAHEDIRESYQIGANAYMIKPLTNRLLKEKMHLFSHYWLDIAQTPSSSWLRPNGYATYD